MKYLHHWINAHVWLASERFCSLGGDMRHSLRVTQAGTARDIV